MRSQWPRILVGLIGSAMLMTACVLGGGDDVELNIATANHSGQVYSLRIEWFLGSSGSRVDSCQLGTGMTRVPTPFEVKFGPGGLEQTDGVDLPTLFDSKSMPPMGDAGYLLTIEEDGQVRVEPLDEPVSPEFLC